MTFSSGSGTASYAGDGSTVSFPTNFKFLSTSHVRVVLRDTGDVETTWVEGTQYTIDPLDVGNPSGGPVTVKTTPTDYTPQIGETLVITLDVPFTQGKALPLGGAFPSTQVEEMGDLAAMQAVKLNEVDNRTLKVPETDTQKGANLDLPLDSVRANKAFHFDSAGKPSMVVPTDASGTVVTATGSTTGRALAERFAEKFNPLDHGCKFDGATNDASAFQTMVNLAEAAAPSIIVMPKGTTNWGSTVTIDTDKVALIGQGPHHTVIQGTFAAGDILHVDGSVATVENLHFEGFRVASSVSKSSGAGIHLERVTRSGLRNVIADGQDGNGNLWHGFWFDKVDMVTLDGFEAKAQQDGVRVNGLTGGPQADLFLDNGKIASCTIGVHCGGGFGGLTIDKVGIINNDQGLKVTQDIQAEANREIFLTSGCLLDSTTVGPCLEITDTGALELMATGTWFASATTHGILVGSGVGAGRLVFTGCRVFNNTSNGYEIQSASPAVIISGGSITANVDGINATVATGKITIGNEVQFSGNTGVDVDWVNIEPRAGRIFEFTIADDAAVSFIPNKSNGLIFVADDGGTFQSGLYRYRAEAAGASITPISEGTLFTSTTGVLAGTTGLDTEVTISTHTDGKIYIENRTGVSDLFRVSLL